MNEQVNHQRRLPEAERGRSQDRSRDDAIIGAALELLAEKGYHGLTMTDVASRAAVSKATLYRRWTAKADLVTDAVATLDPLRAPNYPGTSLRDDLLALIERAGNCDDRSELVVATMEMARLHPDLYRTLSDRFSLFVRTELDMLASQASDAGHAPLSRGELSVLGDTVIALLAHYAGPTGSSVPREQLVGVVEYLLLPLIAGRRVLTGG